MGRIVDRDEASRIADRLRAEGKTILTTNGSFDLLHAGHVRYLREARAQGDVLFVGLNSDASVRGYKGANRPFVGERDRAELLAALEMVDYVVIFDEKEPMRFIEAIRPHVHINGSEYGAECIEAPTVRRLGGRLHLIDRIEGLSTTALARRIAGALAEGPSEALLREAAGLIGSRDR